MQTQGGQARTRALVGALALAGVLAAMLALDRTGYLPSVYRSAKEGADLVAAALVVLAALGAAVAPSRRRLIHLYAAVAILPIALGPWALAPAGFVVLVIGVARVALPVIVQLAVVIVGWLVVPALRIRYLDGAGQADTILLALMWAGLLYAAFYLVIERARALPGEQSSALADAHYLLALPRLVAPFFQPIAPSDLAERERKQMTWLLLRNGIALAAYALALGVSAQLLDRPVRQITSLPVRLAAEVALGYARVAHGIFLAIGLFRLLGFGLRPGFHLPYAARSFPEFFRRYNYYVRDAVLSLFYYPFLGHLRLWLPARVAAVVAAYLALIVGSLLLHDLLVPLSISIAPLETLEQLAGTWRLAGFVILWSLIILPHAGIAPRKEPPRAWWQDVLRVIAVNAIIVALWYVHTR